MKAGIKELIKGEQIDDYVILGCRYTGIHVYKIDGKVLTHVQSIQKSEQMANLIDIELNK